MLRRRPGIRPVSSFPTHPIEIMPRVTPRHCSAKLPALLLLTTLLASPVFAHVETHATERAERTPSAPLSLSDQAAPLSARYIVKVSPRAKSPQPTVKQVWYFSRDSRQVALLKGAIDEIWHRDEEGRMSFERVFHEDQRVVDYTPGELATIGVATEWAALSGLVDAEVLKSLRVVSRRGAGADERVVLTGKSSQGQYQVTWRPALQLPERVQRIERDGRRTEIVLDRHAATAPADWPVVGSRSADYLRLDAADFGDMEYDPVVRKAEALDIRLGWRTAHHHD